MAGKYEDIRRNYTRGGLTDGALGDSPLPLFRRWVDQAVAAELADPTAMSLATIDCDGRPWQRIVLLKEILESGLVFFTNYRSAKAEAMRDHPAVSALFPWNELDRQVAVGGLVQRLDRQESATYFRSRPRESQLAAWASRQSSPIASRADLDAQYDSVKERFKDRDVPVPDFWGGYLLIPDQFEFWQGGSHRMHDRIRSSRTGVEGGEGAWRWERLQP
ncbi:MAG: pyridoxamine 5'-phosphate oxidase [Pseudomonadota bacterium]